jgi:hypothetical protein
MLHVIMQKHSRTHLVPQPGHAERPQLVVKELYPELAGEKRDVLDDRQTDAPVPIFRKLDDGRKKGLGKEVDPNNLHSEIRLAFSLPSSTN